MTKQQVTIPPETQISSCPVMSLGDSNKNFDFYRTLRCKPIPLEEKDCLIAKRKYKKSSIESSHCTRQYVSQVLYKLCAFKKNVQRSIDYKYGVTCKIDKCKGSAIYVSSFDDATGLMTSFEKANLAYKSEELQEIIIRMYQNTNKTFCVVSCYFHGGFIRQLLVFPPRVKKKSYSDVNKYFGIHGGKEKININIVVLDSVSRQHFYRQLPRSVSVLSAIRSNQSQRMSPSGSVNERKKTLVLDYELFQSLAPRTFPNMRAMFSGDVDVDADDEANSYGLEILYSHFQKLGYQSLLQEDSCWFDTWGALITDNKHYGNISISSWNNIKQKMKSLPIDGYGLTHFSCEVFKQYGRTNQFNFPPKVCYNGHLFPEYFLNLTIEYTESIEDHNQSKPSFFYTHLNTGHETTGQRLSQIDNVLSQFLYRSGQLRNTWTIIMSDHGPKTTRFSQEDLAGRYEIGHALMFMILPPNIQRIIGSTKTNSLVDNQRRLITTLDIYGAFKTLYNDFGEGLLGDIPESRYCHDIPIYSFMNCLCDQASQLVNTPTHVQWMAEYALGYLNEELTNALLKNGFRHGYHNCERLIGRRFNKVRRSIDHTGVHTYIMDIVVDKYRGQEIFEVVLKVKLFATGNRINDFKHIKVVKWRRVTIYQHFSKCCDKKVDVELCICRQESTGLRNPGRDVARLLASPVFDAINIPIFLDSKCLLLLKRGRLNSFLSYELTNLCNDRVYEAYFKIENDSGVVATRKLPIHVTVHSWYIYYLSTVLVNTQSLARVQENVTFTMKYIQ